MSVNMTRMEAQGSIADVKEYRLRHSNLRNIVYYHLYKREVEYFL